MNDSSLNNDIEIIDTNDSPTDPFEEWINKILSDDTQTNISNEQMVKLLNSISSTLEHEERVYQENSPDPFEDARHKFPIGKFLEFINEEFIETMMNRCVGSTDEEVRLAGLRAILASLPGITTRFFREIVTLEDFIVKLINWIKSNDKKCPVSIGILGYIMEDNDIVNQVVREEMAPIFLKRINEHLKRNKPMPKFPESGEERNLTEDEWEFIEKISLVKCLSHMGDYQEVIGPFFQEGGVELVNKLLQQPEKEMITETLKFICSLLAHLKFARSFVEKGGFSLMLKLPATPNVAAGVSLCLVGLSPLTTIMEQICQNSSFVEKLVEYGLMLLKVPVAEIKKNGALFFHSAFSFRAIISRFDKVQGLKSLINLLRLPVSFPLESSGAKHLTHCTCLALRSYFRMHIILAGNQLQKQKHRKTEQHNVTSSESLQSFLNNKQDLVAMLQRTRWRPATQFIESGGIELLLGALENSEVWQSSNVAQCALEIFYLLTTAPFTHLPLCETKIESNKTGMSLILDAANGELGHETSIILYALQIISNLVNLPGTEALTHQRKRIWELVREYGGIRVLLDILRHQDFDKNINVIREVTCKILIGLSDDPTINQILKKADVSSTLSDQILNTQKTPDNEYEFHKFKETALELLSKITEKKQETVSSEARDNTLLRLQKAAIVANTPITYNQNELLQIVHEYLSKKGLHKTAATLLEEAKIEPVPKIDEKEEIFSIQSGMSNNETRLDGIVTQYLRQQHRECENPISLLPPFSLLKPHICPLPTKQIGYGNIHSYINSTIYGINDKMKKQTFRKYIYSRFRQIKVYKNEEMDNYISCAEFDPKGTKLYLGCEGGELLIFDTQNPNFKEVHNLESYIEGLKFSNDCSLILHWAGVDSNLYQNERFTSPLFKFVNASYPMFNNANDKIVATGEKVTKIFDTETGELVAELKDPLQIHNFDRVIACFNPYDDLILSDGVLWDYRMPPKIIHRFDKLTKHGTEIFHPNGNEVIINSEIWDLRTFKLMTTCNAIANAKSLSFSPNLEVIYSIYEHEDLETKFRTIDSLSFETIATVDIEKTIIDLTVGPLNYYIGVVCEDSNEYSSCRLFEVGRKPKTEGEEESEEEEEELSDYEDEYEDPFHRVFDLDVFEDLVPPDDLILYDDDVEMEDLDEDYE